MLTFLMCFMWAAVGINYGLLLIDARGRHGFVSLVGVIACVILTMGAIVATLEVVR